MPLLCEGCKKDAGIDGIYSSFWKCQACLDREKEEERLSAILRTRQRRQEIADGAWTAFVPGGRLPLDTLEEEIQKYADENYCNHWERTEKDILLWTEM